jgi:predicted 2-oxoglutarate/Fe(II)-dependent dioxygenase YbiX
MNNNRKTVISAGDDVLFTVSDVLSADECASFIRLIESKGPEVAPITTGYGFVMRPDVRNNTRVMIDDPARAGWLWDRVAAFIPKRIGPWTAVGLNERFRYYRYDPGQYFRWHGDGAFTRSQYERSLLTAMVYLSDDFEGGSTDFRDYGSVIPKRGSALFFEHPLIHQGAPVVSGRKYVLRTDVMYQRQSAMAAGR